MRGETPLARKLLSAVAFSVQRLGRIPDNVHGVSRVSQENGLDRLTSLSGRLAHRRRAWSYSPQLPRGVAAGASVALKINHVQMEQRCALQQVHSSPSEYSHCANRGAVACGDTQADDADAW